MHEVILIHRPHGLCRPVTTSVNLRCECNDHYHVIEHKVNCTFKTCDIDCTLETYDVIYKADCKAKRNKFLNTCSL